MSNVAKGRRGKKVQDSECESQVSPAGGSRQWARFLLPAVCLLLLALLAACGAGEQAQESGQPANQQTSQEITQPAELPTEPATAEPTDPPPTETPIPGSPTANATVVAAFAAATAASAELEQTRVSVEQTRVIEELQTIEALAPIREELALLGIDANQGALGFVHPPIHLEVNDPDENDFQNNNIFTIAQDFVMAADITWASASADSGCGFVVRSDGNQEALNQIVIGLTRSQEGHVLFAEQIAGEIDRSEATDLFAGGIDPQFDPESGGTNRLVVVARDQEFTVYSNGIRLGTIPGRAGFDEGFVAFIAVNQSGGIICDFDNAWLWKLN